MTTDITASVRLERPAAALAVIAFIAFLDAAFEYLWPGNGIHGTEGALLVVISTLLMAAAAALIAARAARGWLRVLLDVLIFIDIWGTGVAAYFLENWILVVLSVVALAAFLVHVIRPRGARMPEVA